MKRFVLILWLAALFLPAIQANNIAVANVSVTDQSALLNHCNVKFDLSWDNSWRTTAVPGNWDAAWVFVKYRISGGVWKHASLDTATDSHTPASGSVITPGKDFKGVFIYRAVEGSGTNTWTNIKLRWKYGLDEVPDDATLEVRVFAIEMVYIPQEAYYLGDGNGSSESLRAWHRYGFDNTSVLIGTVTDTVQVDSGSPSDDDYAKALSGAYLTVNGPGGILTTGGAVNQTNPDFPTGYKAFYLMKYETSVEQYMDFLNCLTRAQQVNRVETDISIGTTSVTNVYVMSNNTMCEARNGIRCSTTIPASDPVVFFCDADQDGIGNENNDGQNIVGVFFSWLDHAAYSDWAGLRPMTEPEYEKACRGPNPAVLGEYAWGNTNIHTSAYTLTNYGAPDEGISNPGVNTGNANHNFLMSYGPVRCGVFAAVSSNHTRQETGATYYGVMEMSGNSPEYCIMLGSPAGRSFTGKHGDGELTNDGYGNVDYWPGINGNNSAMTPNTVYGGTTGITSYAGLFYRGGSSSSSAAALGVSYRYQVSDYTFREYFKGFRSAHTAP